MKILNFFYLSKNSLSNFFITLIIFFISLYISPYFTEGDQIHYRKVYSSLVDYNFFNGFIFYKNSVSSTEPISYALTWIACHFFNNKDLYISFVNATLAYTLSSLLSKWKVAIPIIFIVILTNFYLYVLYFSAERLKYGILFFLISLYYLEHTKKFYFFSLLAILSHIQTFILYGSLIFYNTILNIKDTLITLQIKKLFLVSIILMIGSLFIMQEQILDKFAAYHNQYGISAFFKSSILLLLALYYSKNKSETLLLFIPLFVAIFLVGEMRINMLSYFLFMYYALQVNRGYNFGVILTSIYNLYKSILYINNIFLYNYGGSL